MRKVPQLNDGSHKCGPKICMIFAHQCVTFAHVLPSVVSFGSRFAPVVPSVVSSGSRFGVTLEIPPNFPPVLPPKVSSGSRLGVTLEIPAAPDRARAFPPQLPFAPTAPDLTQLVYNLPQLACKLPHLAYNLPQLAYNLRQLPYNLP